MKTFRILAAASLLAAGRCFANEEATTGGRLLSESMTARPSGLAEAGTALTGDLTALSFNPAGLPLMKRNEAAARFQASAGGVSAGTLAYGGRRGRFGWGLGAAFLDAGRIDLSFSGGQQFSRRAQQDTAGQIAVGVIVTDFLSIGVGGRYIRSSLVEEFTATAYAGDAGIMIQMPIDGWQVGASVRNMGGELTYKRVGDPLPGEVRVGTSYSYSPGGKSAGDVPVYDWYTREEEETPIFTVLADGVRDKEGNVSGAGAFEWTKWPKAAFRAGYGFGENSSGLTLGFGVNLVRYSLDYSWRFVEDLNAAHRISFSVYWE